MVRNSIGVLVFFVVLGLVYWKFSSCEPESPNSKFACTCFKVFFWIILAHSFFGVLICVYLMTGSG
jgi:hypothetical protein